MKHLLTTHHARGDYDVVIVGARIAGAATALELADAGHRVALIDRAEFPSDTLSTHAIARTGVILLDRLGVLDAVVDSGAPAVRDVAFHHAGSVTRRTIKDRHGVDFVVAPRRHILDALLLDAARAAGAEVLTATTVTDVVHDRNGRATAVRARTANGPTTISARLVVGADGLRSRVARSVRAPFLEQRAAGGALHYAYFRGHWPAMEYYVGEHCSAGIFPTHHGDACIWVSNPIAAAEQTRRRSRNLTRALLAMIGEVSTDLLARTIDATPTSTVHGQLGLPNHRRRSTGNGWALVGDAAYHRDAITGHGISDALRDAALLGRAVDRILTGACDESSALADYAAEQHRLMREIFDLTQRFVEFPPAERFIELQVELSRAIERQAEHLAAHRGLARVASSPR
jgi:2-polyprenyl-6-methoxyphenol hydroxylase-like FAD-dependent oxidoreductase